MTVSDIDGEHVAVACGGEMFLEDSFSSVPNQGCTTLSETVTQTAADDHDEPTLSADGYLNQNRIGTASLLIDNGRTLWILGGSDGEVVRGNSEYVSTHPINGLFTTNGAGPELEIFGMYHHCIARISPEVAILLGGSIRNHVQIPGVDQQPGQGTSYLICRTINLIQSYIYISYYITLDLVF